MIEINYEALLRSCSRCVALSHMYNFFESFSKLWIKYCVNNRIYKTVHVPVYTKSILGLHR